MSIKKINKPYFIISTAPICSVLFDEFLMKKVMKILYKYKNEIAECLYSNKEHLIQSEWALVYPNGKQVSFRSFKKVNDNDIERLIGYVNQFVIHKEENIFDIGDKSIFDDEVKSLVEKELS